MSILLGLVISDATLARKSHLHEFTWTLWVFNLRMQALRRPQPSQQFHFGKPGCTVLFP
jgi:hypothetical protein